MVSLSNKYLVVLDPGLRELGGHHPASIKSIAQASQHLTDCRLLVYCNQQCPAGFAQQLEAENVEVLPVFKTDFYQYFYHQPSPQDLFAYIQRLAQEYYDAIFDAVGKLSEAEKITFWCHTVDWPHAHAISLALSLLEQKWGEPCFLDKVNINICLMYHPYRQLVENETAIIKQKMRFEIPLRRLVQFPNVALYGADAEIIGFAQGLAGGEVGLQPCLLLGDLSRDKVKCIDNVNKQIILYVGDAKENKGFCELPTMVEGISQRYPNWQIVIQYSINKEAVHLVTIDQHLQLLNTQRANLTLIRGFIEHEQLMRLFKDSSIIAFNYNNDVYQYQSSGVLWLAAHFKLQIICFSDTWVTREAKRLGLAVIKWALNDRYVGSAPQMVSEPNENPYSIQLYMPLSQWLKKCLGV
ncbi:hypothetical protein ACVFI8_02630 [Agarivorans sp. MS3-6]